MHTSGLAFLFMIAIPQLIRPAAFFVLLAFFHDLQMGPHLSCLGNHKNHFWNITFALHAKRLRMKSHNFVFTDKIIAE
jgi:hypothetical protein